MSPPGRRDARLLRRLPEQGQDRFRDAGSVQGKRIACAEICGFKADGLLQLEIDPFRNAALGQQLQLVQAQGLALQSKDDGRIDVLTSASLNPSRFNRMISLTARS